MTDDSDLLDFDNDEGQDDSDKIGDSDEARPNNNPTEREPEINNVDTRFKRRKVGINKDSKEREDIKLKNNNKWKYNLFKEDYNKNVRNWERNKLIEIKMFK